MDFWAKVIVWWMVNWVDVLLLIFIIAAGIVIARGFCWLVGLMF